MKVPLKLPLSDLLEELSSKNLLLESPQGKDAIITGISAVEDCNPGDLIFVDKEKYFEIVKLRKPSVVVTSKALKTRAAEFGDYAVIVVANVSLAQAIIKGKYASRDFTQSGWMGVHPSAVIHETAVLGPRTVIEPRVVIGKNVKIGENCRIMSGSVIEDDVIMGDNTIIHPLVLIGYNCRIGKSVTVGSGTVIGSSGFGYAQDEKRRSYHIPQTGIVVVEDDVNIGANNCIDRAAYHETRIGRGTKIDNLCHIAHNVTVGQDCLLTAMLCVAGSTKIGNRVVASGQTGILDHVTVGDDVVLVHKAGVSKDIQNPGVYAGAPVQPMAEYMKNTAVLRSANELRKRIGSLEEEIAVLKNSETSSS